MNAEEKHEDNIKQTEEAFEKLVKNKLTVVSIRLNHDERSSELFFEGNYPPVDSTIDTEESGFTIGQRKHQETNSENLELHYIQIAQTILYLLNSGKKVGYVCHNHSALQFEHALAVLITGSDPDLQDFSSIDEMIALAKPYYEDRLCIKEIKINDPYYIYGNKTLPVDLSTYLVVESAKDCNCDVVFFDGFDIVDATKVRKNCTDRELFNLFYMIAATENTPIAIL